MAPYRDDLLQDDYRDMLMYPEDRPDDGWDPAEMVPFDPPRKNTSASRRQFDVKFVRYGWIFSLACWAFWFLFGKYDGSTDSFADFVGVLGIVYLPILVGMTVGLLFSGGE